MKAALKFFGNMRWKLILSYFILILFNISLMGCLFYFFTMGHFISTREEYLATTADYFSKFVTSNMESEEDLAGASKFFLRQNWEKLDYDLQVSDKYMSIAADSRSVGEISLPFMDKFVKDSKIKAVIKTGKPQKWSETQESAKCLCYSAPIFFNGGIVGAVKVSMSTEDFNSLFSILKDYFIITFTLSLVAALCLAMIFTRNIMRPVRMIRDATEEISQGNFDCSIAYEANDELGDLSSSINKMAGDLKKMDQTRNLFLANISHELRTPLTIIKGFAMTMAGDPEAREDQKHFLETINKEADRLTRLVSELLELTRIRTGKIAMKMAPCRIGEILESVVFQMRPKAEGAGCSLTSEVRGELPEMSGDADKLKEVMINLTDNAIKYSAGHGERPEVTVEAEADGGMIVIRVRDTGPGIAPEDLDKVFERFFRSGSRGQKIEGAGLGLAIVNEIVKAHGGSVSVESPDRKGCIFTVKLPMQRH